MGTKTKIDATSDLHLIMGEVHALVEMVVPSDEMLGIESRQVPEPVIAERTDEASDLRWV